MRILEVDAGGSSESPDGVGAVLWSLSEQLAARHEVTLVVRTPLSDVGRSRAAEQGFEVDEVLHRRSEINVSGISKVMRERRPEVVHIHGAFYPHLAALSALCRLRRVPYVYSPHGGLSPRVIHQRPGLRGAYRLGIERTIARHARAAFGCTGEECSDIRSLAGRGLRSVTAVGPPVAVVLDDQAPRWSPSSSSAPLTYLGRYEIFQKGLDRMVELARAAPELSWALYGEAAPADLGRWNALMATAPPNVTSHDSVYGKDKWEVLAKASLYVQCSRFEGFPVSIAEAMSLGVPCAISEQLGLATEFRVHDLGLVLPSDITSSVAAVRGLLADPDQQSRFSTNARNYAEAHFEPARVANRYAAVYGQVAGW